MDQKGCSKASPFSIQKHPISTYIPVQIDNNVFNGATKRLVKLFGTNSFRWLSVKVVFSVSVQTPSIAPTLSSWSLFRWLPSMGKSKLLNVWLHERWSCWLFLHLNRKRSLYSHRRIFGIQIVHSFFRTAGELKCKVLQDLNAYTVHIMHQYDGDAGDCDVEKNHTAPSTEQI